MRHPLPGFCCGPSRLCLVAALLLGGLFAEALTPNIMCGGPVQTNVCLHRFVMSVMTSFF